MPCKAGSIHHVYSQLYMMYTVLPEIERASLHVETDVPLRAAQIRNFNRSNLRLTGNQYRNFIVSVPFWVLENTVTVAYGPCELTVLFRISVE